MSLPQSAIPNPHSAILLVEDNPDDALLVQRAVRKANLPNPVRVVEDGQAAMDYLAACRDDPVGRLHPVGDVPPERLYPMPTLVLLDLNLPRKSGFEVLAWLREQPRLRHLPVVVLTSSKDIPTIERAFGLGANAFLVKPPAPESLGDLVTSLAAEFERPPRVLLIDDSPDDRALAMRELRRAFPGLQAVEIDSADGLAAALEAGDFDLVISDVSMPWATGLGNLRAFKARWPDCPVIILTGTGSEQIAAESITAGLDDYVLKSPHHIARLPLAARSALGRARQRCELRESEARYRDLVENSQDLICTHDLEGQLLSVNEAAVRLTGYPHEALLRMNLADLLVPDVRRTFDAYLKKIRATGQARGLMQIQTAGGETRYWGYSNTLRTEGVPQPIVRGMARDVTERVRAEEALAASEAELRALFTSMHDVVLVIDREGVYRKIAPTNPDFLYKPPGELLGKTLRDVFPAEQAGAFIGVVHRVLETQRTDQIEYQLTVNERTLWFETFVSPMTEDTTLWVARDITERKQRQRELEAVNRISTALRAAQTLDEMLPRLLDETLAVLGTEAGIIFLYNAGRDEVRKAATHGWLTAIPDRPLPAQEGITGQVLAAGETYAAREFLRDPRLRESLRQQVPAGWGGACVPIRAAQEIVGFFFISVQLPRELTAQEARLLTTLAEIAGNAIHRARLYEQTVRQVERLAALHSIDMAISASLDLRLTLNVLVSHVVTQLGVDAAEVLLLSPHLQVLEYAAGRGFRSAAIERTRIRLGEGHAGLAALERRTISDFGFQNADFGTPSQSAIPNPQLEAEGFAAHASVPLIAKGQVKGVLEIFHRSRLDPDPEWMNFLELLAGQAAIAIDNAQLFDGLQRSNVELSLAYDATIAGWSHALDLRDRETEGHTQRVTEITLRLAEVLGIAEAELIHIRRGALLHDIGKMGVPDSILLKLGPLTDEEWVIMRLHPQLAYDMLSPINYLRSALDIPYCHHEKWDGTGYPRGLKGEQIPLAARPFAVVDVWDALRSDRPYRAAWPEEKVIEHIKAGSGSHFDPQVVEAFLGLQI